MADAARPAAKLKPPTRALPFWQQAAGALWQGFSEPSMLAFRVFLVALAATLVFCLWFFSIATLAGPMGRYLPRSALDAEGFATHEALRTGHEMPRHPRLIILGTSTVAQAIGSGVAMEKQIDAGTGKDWQVVMLVTPLQSPVEQFALIETALASQTADSPPVIVALGFGVQRLRWTPEQTLRFVTHPRLGLSSDWADDEVRAIGGTPLSRVGFYICDNLPFVLLNGSEALLRIALHQPAHRTVDGYAVGAPHHPPAIRATLGQEIRDGMARQSDYFAQIGRLAAHIAKVPNTKLVLLEEPISPDLIAEQGLGPLREQLTAALADPTNGTMPAYWPIIDAAALSGKDFFDDLHVYLGLPQDRIQAVIAGHVIAADPSRGAERNGN